MSFRKRPFNPLGSSSASNKHPRTLDTLVPLSHSSGSPPTDAPVVEPRNPTRQNVKAAGYAVLSTLKSSMKLLQRSSGMFEPLSQAVGELLNVLESIESATKGHPGLLEMVSELPQWVVILSSYLSSPQPDMKQSSQLAEQLAKDLKKHAEDLESREKLGTFKRCLDSEDSFNELRQSYRRIETSFCQLQADATLNTWKISQDHLQYSRLNDMCPSHNARYDSSFAHKVKRRECLKNTRVTVLEDSRRWIYSPGSAKIYWLNGMAGTGKTTIAYTICSELEQNGRLGASFFCSRASSDCQDVNRILPTIAYQLAQKFYPFRSALCQRLGKEPSIGQRELRVQFQYLIRDPLVEVKEMLPHGVVVVIDALDECTDPETTDHILKQLLGDVTGLPVRFYLTSRPEPSISNTILSGGPGTRSVLHLHNVEQQLVNADIETYLNVSLAEVPLTPAQIKHLAEQAGVLFIYATTVVRYILSGPTGANQKARVQAVLNSDASSGLTKKDREIDRLYRTILDAILETERLESTEVNVIKDVLWTVTTAREPLTIATLSGLLTADIEAISAALGPLRSVLNVTEGVHIVSPIHASFPEFVLNAERSGEWSCRGDQYHQIMATRCFNVMRAQLRFNICGIKNSFRMDLEIPDLQTRVAEMISSELFYSCLYWSEHLRRSGICRESLDCVGDFLLRQFLFWIEVLNLKGRVDRGTRILREVGYWLLPSLHVTQQSVCHSFTWTGSEALKMVELMRDADQFVHTFATHPIRLSTPHIYISCLPLTPKKSRLWEAYRVKTPGLLWLNGSGVNRQHGQPMVTFPLHNPYPSCRTKQSYSSRVNTPSINQSGATTPSVPPQPEGSTPIVANSGNGVTGGKNLYSGIVHAINSYPGHTNTISSVAFSPDGTRIVSGSWDQTIRVWSSRDGTPFIRALEGHLDMVSSVAFSSDSIRIVSGSWDKTVRVWDSYTGSLIAGPFQGHTDTVSSVAFSPDGSRIVSGSWDSTVRVWDSHNGIPLSTPFQGHDDMITSVAFSPVGSQVVSGSWDRSIRIWDSSNGTLFGYRSGWHTDTVTSVAYSPDGTQIISGSSDGVVRLWRSRDCMLLASLFQSGSGAAVTSVAFSPDGAQIVSGTWNSTIWVWKYSNGAMVANVLRGHTEVITSVAFSSDSTKVVSSSWDKTIRVWNSHGLIPIPSSFTNHTKATTSVDFIHNNTHVDIPFCDPVNQVPAVERPIVRSSQTQNSEGWSICSDGWVQDSSRNLLFWLPEHLRNIFPIPPNRLVIKDASLAVHFDSLRWGYDWDKDHSSLIGYG